MGIISFSYGPVPNGNIRGKLVTMSIGNSEYPQSPIVFYHFVDVNKQSPISRNHDNDRVNQFVMQIFFVFYTSQFGKNSQYVMSCDQKS